MEPSCLLILQQGAAMCAGAAVLGCIGSALCNIYAYVNEVPPSATDRILKAFEQGLIDCESSSCPEAGSSRATVPRAVLKEQLEDLLAPQALRTYAVIVGEQGCGKSTAVRQAIASLPDPKGVVYYDTPAMVSLFSTGLAQLLGVEQCLQSHRREHEPKATIGELIPLLKKAASRFSNKHKRPMTLVIDSAELLASECPELLAVLQCFAKRCADSGSLQVIFVTSLSALPVMESHSAWSHARSPVLVDEVPDEQAIAYLVDRGVPQAAAEEAVQTLTGGLFGELIMLTNKLNRKMSIEDIRAGKDVNTQEVLERIKVPVDHLLFARLLVEESIQGTPGQLGMDRAQRDLLVKGGILSVHPGYQHSFRDRHKIDYFRRQQLSKQKPAPHAG